MAGLEEQAGGGCSPMSPIRSRSQLQGRVTHGPALSLSDQPGQSLWHGTHVHVKHGRGQNGPAGDHRDHSSADGHWAGQIPQ